MFELRQLDYFRAVAEFGSISRAAAALHLTQPTLSRQIAQLEKNLGYKLLRRTPTGTKLTVVGEGLRTHLLSIFELVDRVPEVLQSASAGGHLVHLGVPSGVPHGWIEQYLASVAAVAPEIRFAIVEATSEEQRRMLNTGLLDLSLMHTEPPELHAEMLFRQRLGCVFREDTLPVDRTEIDVTDLAGLRVMAHSSKGEEISLRSLAAASGTQVGWLFRAFSEHSELIAKSSGVDAVLIGSASARKWFPDWPWLPLNDQRPEHWMRTWVAWANTDTKYNDVLLDCMRETARVHRTDPTYVADA
ncbi:LysR family transcriptional regulator [Amycolatopsis sp. K13G38]|uniref:LysR family transcriptional regulator n=1 Tax=Amycolatopsis acididurans TaxID=2724524 RepID=A0ABX1JHL3_9PSEU|nr:LysR family transcriptional regulator [Amycolatopsis acididurans]NKQ57910.1 LysR family transcriptional regulator [Amycolatopsis acididurans]